MVRPKDQQKQFIEIMQARGESELKLATEQKQHDFELRQQNEKNALGQFRKMGMDVNALLKARQEATEQSAVLLRKTEAEFEYKQEREEHTVEKMLLPKTRVRGTQILHPFHSTSFTMSAPAPATELRNGNCWWVIQKSDNGGGFFYFDAHWGFSFTPKTTRNYVLMPYTTLRGNCWMHSDNSTWDFSDDYAHAFIEIRTDVWTGYWRGEQVMNIFDRNGRNIDVIEGVDLRRYTPRIEVLAARVPILIRVAARIAVNSGGSAYCVLKFGVPNRSYPICCPQLQVIPL